MGCLHDELGDHQQAKECYERALSIRLNKLGPDHVDVACTYHLLSDVQRVLDAHQQMVLRSDVRAQFVQPKHPRSSRICNIL